MTKRARYSPIAISLLILLSVSAFAQTPEGRQTNSTPPAQELSTPNSPESMVTEIALLRKSLQSLNTRLREISDKLLAPGVKQADPTNEKQNRIALSLDLLSRAEQRAEVLRKQLIELIEKETYFRTRLVQIDEDMRPDSIERAMAPVGTTRTMEIRDVRRRVLENERRGIEILLSQTSQSRLRLDDDVKQADALVSRLRQRIMPLIDREIEKISPN